MMEEIKECPYCGSDQVETMETWGKRYVNCNDCNATGPTTTGSKNDAVLLWNAASNALAAKDEEIEKLRKEHQDYINDVVNTNTNEWAKYTNNLKAEIARLVAACDDLEGEYLRVKEQRDEARRVARVWYSWYNTEYKTVKLINDTFRTAMRDGVVIEAKFGNTGYPHSIPKRMRYYANESGQWLEPVYEEDEERE